jgi:hypothetical protein
LTGPGRVLALDFSGLSVRLTGLDERLEADCREEWRLFLAERTAEGPWLDVAVVSSGRPLIARPTMRPSMTCEVDQAGARFACDEGSIDLGLDGPASARLGDGDPSWRFWGLANLIAAGLAYRLPSRPGALLHAAGIVIDGRAFLLTGASGSGKSTWTRAAREGGARVVSDDAVVLDAASGTVELLGTPIRAHEAHPGGPGRWPVAAILHARWGRPPALTPVTALAFHARLAANLLFLAPAWGHDARLDRMAGVLAGGPRQRELTFAPDPSFVELLRRLE